MLVLFRGNWYCLEEIRKVLEKDYNKNTFQMLYTQYMKDIVN